MLFLFMLAVAMTLAVLNVYARDLQQITGGAAALLFFLCPILYPLENVPQEWHGIPVRAIMAANPLAEFITAFRNVLYDLTMPSTRNLVMMTAWTAGALLLAWWVYLKKGQDIGEAV